MSTQPLVYNSVDEFAKAVKSKYPQYKDWPSDHLTAEMLRKYPKAYSVQGFDLAKYDHDKAAQPRPRTAWEYAKAVPTGVAAGIAGMAEFGADISRKYYGHLTGLSGIGGPGGAAGATALDVAKDFVKGLSAGYEARQEAKAKGEGWAGQTLATLEQYPLIGGMVQKAEKGGTQMFSPEAIEAASEGVTYYFAPDAIEKAGKVVKVKIQDAPKVLESKAADLNTKVLKTAKAGRPGYNEAVALQVAQEGIISTAKKLPDKIEARRVEVHNQAEGLTDTLTRQGNVIDVTQSVGRAVNKAIDILNDRGRALDPVVQRGINQLITQLTLKLDPATRSIVTRDLSRLTPREMVELLRHDGLLSERSGFLKSQPDAVNKFASQIRGAMESELGATSPALQRLRQTESRLIEARDASRATVERIKNDMSTKMKATLYTSGAIVLYEAMRLAGLGWTAAFGGAVGLSSLAKSTLSRTARAALYARMADLIDSAVNTHVNAPRGPIRPPLGLPGGSPPPPTGGPQGAAPQGVTPAAGALPRGAAPFAPATVVSTNPPNAPTWSPGAEPLALPAKATRARAGSGDYVKASTPSTSSTPSSVSGDVIAHGTKSVSPSEAKAAQDLVTAINAVKAPPSEIGFDRSIKTGPDIGEQVRGERRSTPSTRVTKASQSEKALMDRIDDLQARIDQPKSGADRSAAMRELGDIKKMLDKTGTVPDDVKARLRKRMLDREWRAKNRAEAAAQAPVEAGAITGEAASGGTEVRSTAASPEDLMIALDEGYAQIDQMYGKKEMSQLLRNRAKQAKLSLEQQIESVKEVINFLSKNPPTRGE